MTCSDSNETPSNRSAAAAAVIVHRAAQPGYGDITGEELTASAARVFSMLDEEEDAPAR